MMSARAQRLFQQLGEELKHQAGAYQLVLIHEPEGAETFHVHSFPDVALLESVLQAVLDRVRSGAHERNRTAVVLNRERPS